MKNTMANHEEDKRFADDVNVFSSAGKSDPVSRGPETHLKKRLPQLNNAFPPYVEHVEKPGSMAQRLVFGHREETHRVILWTKGHWAEKIR